MQERVWELGVDVQHKHLFKVSTIFCGYIIFTYFLDLLKVMDVLTKHP
jgi:hypothetical protein